MKRSVALFALLLAACSFIDKHDPAAGYSAEKLYREAKEALDGGQYDLAIKRYETLESRFPYGRYSQQGQLEIAYAYYKQSEQASAVALLVVGDRKSTRLNSSHTVISYAVFCLK